MTSIDLLPDAFAWTGARLAAVTTSDLDQPTPCDGWAVRDLLDHMVGSVAMLTEAVAGPARIREAGEWRAALDEIAAQSRRAWSAPGVAAQSFEIPIGRQPATALASITVVELVVHGWDVGQGTGEAPEIPDHLALPSLEFVQAAITEETRGVHFAPALDAGDTPSDRLVAFLGRKPR